MVVLATQTPLTRVLPAPQAAATCVIMPSGWGIGAGVIACAEVVTAKAKPATAINLSIVVLLFSSLRRWINTTASLNAGWTSGCLRPIFGW
jgi:hypothetical protein